MNFPQCSFFSFNCLNNPCHAQETFLGQESSGSLQLVVTLFFFFLQNPLDLRSIVSFLQIS